MINLRVMDMMVPYYYVAIVVPVMNHSTRNSIIKPLHSTVEPCYRCTSVRYPAEQKSNIYSTAGSPTLIYL